MWLAANCRACDPGLAGSSNRAGIELERQSESWSEEVKSSPGKVIEERSYGEELV